MPLTNPGFTVSAEVRNEATSSDYILMIDVQGTLYKITKANLLPSLNTNTGVNLGFASDGDTNGLFYYLGTNKATTNWSNPSGNSLIVSASSTEIGLVSSLADRQDSEWFSVAQPNSWVSFELAGGRLLCNYYSIRSRAINVDYYPRNWTLQGSNNGTTWIDLDSQVNNQSLSSVSQWLSLPVTSTTPYSHFRIIQNDLDSSNANYLCLGEVELYGSYS